MAEVLGRGLLLQPLSAALAGPYRALTTASISAARWAGSCKGARRIDIAPNPARNGNADLRGVSSPEMKRAARGRPAHPAGAGRDQDWRHDPPENPSRRQAGTVGSGDDSG